MCRTQKNVKSFCCSLHTVCFGWEFCSFWNSTANENRFSSYNLKPAVGGFMGICWFYTCKMIQIVYSNWEIIRYYHHSVSFLHSAIYFLTHCQKNMPELNICSEVYLQLHFFLLYLKPQCFHLKKMLRYTFFFLSDNNNTDRYIYI